MVLRAETDLKAEDDLKLLKEQVFAQMLLLGYAEETISELGEITLGFLRRDATQRHGVTRFHPGIDLKGELGPKNIRRVDLHREILAEDWRDYGAYVLYHEYCHCLGYPGHGRDFRAFERLWGDDHSRKKGRQFTEFLRQRNAVWNWICPTCKAVHARRKRSNGRYKCRKCDIILLDVEKSNLAQ
jgi:hypothetical protein